MTQSEQVAAMTAPFIDWQERSLERATAALRAMLAPTQQPLVRGRHRFTAPDEAMIEQENG